MFENDDLYAVTYKEDDKNTGIRGTGKEIKNHEDEFRKEEENLGKRKP